MVDEAEPVSVSKFWILRYPQKLIFDFFCAFLILLIVDLGARFWFADELKSWEAPLPSFHSGHRILQGNPYLIFEYAPGVWEEQGVEVRINSLGLRGDEIDIPKPKERRRFMTTGDSSVFGFGVPEEAVFSSVIEKSLQQVAGKNEIEAINGAIPGYSTYQTINLLRLRTWKADPDLLIVGNLWSDNNFGSFVDKELIATTAGFEQDFVARFHRILTLSALYRVADWRRRVRAHANKIGEVGQSIYEGKQTGFRRVDINDYAKNLEILIDSAHDRDAEVMFLMLANEDDIKNGLNIFQAWEPYREVMRDTAKRHAIPLVSMVELFQKSGYSSKELFLDQMHPTVLGHRLLGEELSRVMEGWASGGRLEGEPTGQKRPKYTDTFGGQQYPDAPRKPEPERKDEPAEEAKDTDEDLEPEELSLDGMVSIKDRAHPDGEFWIDRYEFPNRKDDLPRNGFSFRQAEKLCAAKGKRLCTAAEWRRSCMGSKGHAFSYGDTYRRGVCNIQKTNTNSNAEIPFESLLAKSGTKMDCRSDEGVFDLVGNVEEWVSEDWAGSDGLLEGGGWSTFREHASCLGVAVRQPDYRVNLERPFESAGVRCCWSETEPSAADVRRDSKRILAEAKSARDDVEYDPSLEVVISGKTFIDRLEYPNQFGARPWTVVNWEEASELCDAAGKRLCESHEWESACGSGRLFPYGDDYVQHACAVEQKELLVSGRFFGCLSPSGALDMVGNVWEWTATKHRAPNGSLPTEPQLREIRGGSWFVNHQKGSCYPFDDRSAAVQTQGFPDLGFRCCRGPVLPKNADAEEAGCGDGQIFRAGTCVDFQGSRETIDEERKR
ncbi:MAG: SUMF1/EgtB/PvdO family nonheme iron enzyme [Myxococcota bacterium]|nr:SUMF1/EgtB/PvdO family nonheme iron enzyme [Myxococcota bacterium]